MTPQLWARHLLCLPTIMSTCQTQPRDNPIIKILSSLRGCRHLKYSLSAPVIWSTLNTAGAVSRSCINHSHGSSIRCVLSILPPQDLWEDAASCRTNPHIIYEPLRRNWDASGPRRSAAPTGSAAATQPSWCRITREVERSSAVLSQIKYPLNMGRVHGFDI